MSCECFHRDVVFLLQDSGEDVGCDGAVLVVVPLFDGSVQLLQRRLLQRHQHFRRLVSCLAAASLASLRGCVLEGGEGGSGM